MMTNLISEAILPLNPHAARRMRAGGFDTKPTAQSNASSTHTTKRRAHPFAPPAVFYVVGRARLTEKTDILKLTARSYGWDQKSHIHPELTVQYAKHETYDTVCDWLNHDLFPAQRYFDNAASAQFYFEQLDRRM